MPEADAPITDPRLIESEQRYLAVIDTASDMIQSVRADGTFEFVNNAWRRALGYTDEDLRHLTVWEIIEPSAIDHCMPLFMKTMNGESIDYIETSFLRKDGTVVPVEGSVVPRMLGDTVVATHGFFRDISERLRARALEERTAQLEREEQARYLEKMAALGKLSAGLAHELNNPAAAVQRASAGMVETIQRRDAAMRHLAGVGLTREGWGALEQICARCANNLHLPANERELDPIALSDAESTLEEWLEDHDVARSWEIAPTLAEARIGTDDLDAIASGIATSELPWAINWITDTLVLGESTAIISESSRRIAELVQAIKGYSHMDRALEHDGDIHDGLENTLIILAHRMKSVDVHREYDRSLPAIRMYGNSLNQVWTNIIDNAVDAMNGSGRIIIRTRRDDGCAVVEIEDNGSGIPADVLPRIFEPFYTSKPQGEGTGLGLDTAWRIVTKEHEGTISATSEPGKTVFQVRLPIDPAPHDESSTAE